MNQDVEHLRLLSIFHYVLAGLTTLFSLLPVFHLVLGIFMVSGRLEGNKDPMLPIMGWFLVICALLLILTGLTFSGCLILAARSLAQHRRYTYCLVVAALSSMFVPFGTVLGVFTIIVLMRPSARQLFESGGSPAATVCNDP